VPVQAAAWKEHTYVSLGCLCNPLNNHLWQDVTCAERLPCVAQEVEEDRGGVRVAVSRYVQRKAAQKKAGVYAIYNSSGEAQYIGFARSILAAVKVGNNGRPSFPNNAVYGEALVLDLLLHAQP